MYWVQRFEFWGMWDALSVLQAGQLPPDVMACRQQLLGHLSWWSPGTRQFWWLWWKSVKNVYNSLFREEAQQQQHSMIRRVPVQRPPCVGCRKHGYHAELRVLPKNASTRVESTCREVSFMWLLSGTIDAFICKILSRTSEKRTKFQSLALLRACMAPTESVSYSACAKTLPDIFVRLVCSLVHYW